MSPELTLTSVLPTSWNTRHTIAAVAVAILGVAAVWFVATRVGQAPAQTSALVAPPASTPLDTTTVAPTTTTTTTTTVPPTTVAPTTVPALTYPSPTLPTAPPPTLPVITVPAYVPGPVVRLVMQYSPFPPPTTTDTSLPVPTLPKTPASLTAFGLAQDSSGCNGEVCIELSSQGGSGPVIIDWEGMSSSPGPCSQIQLRLNNVLVAETARTCDGPGDYSASWMPDLTFAPSAACVDDVYRSGYPCEAIQLRSLF